MQELLELAAVSADLNLLAERHLREEPFDPYRESEFHLHAPALITFPIWIGNS